MDTFLLIVYLLLFIFAASKNFKWALFWVIFTLPTYLIRFKVFGLPATLLESEILALFLMFIIRILRRKGTQTINFKNNIFLPFYLSAFLFVVAATLSMFISPHLRVAAGIWKAYFIEPILFLIIFIKIIRKKDLNKVFLALGFNALILSGIAIYQKFTGAFIPNEFWAAAASRRVTSIFPYPNALALYLAPLVVLFIGVLPEKIRSLNFKDFIVNRKLGIGSLLVASYWLLVIVSGLLAVYFTKSKGAFLGILAGLIFYAIFYKGYRKTFAGILVLSFIALSFYFFISGNSLADALRGRHTVEGGGSLSTRIEMWNETWQMLKTKPVLGAGLGGYQTAVAPFHKKKYIEIYLYPHNIILNFWSEIGLLGLLAFLGIIIWFFKPANTPSIIIVKAGMVTLLIHGLVDVPYFKNDLSVLFWIIIGMMVVLINSRQPIKIEKY